jgi:D-alanyl-D-alanine carboxypeptidase/D-alanyl-D-alanine-endopeptidase (penicillin-binding protein 4)
LSIQIFLLNRSLLTVIAIGLFLWLTACNPLKKSFRKLDQNPVLANSFTGFVLFDPENKQTLFNQQGSKYFTPASNTKLFTFYLANQILGDSIPAFLYRNNADTLVLWATGDPGFLNPELPGSGVYDFLKGKPIHLVKEASTEPKYGPGWAWDDYSGSYQREKTAFPIYGNALQIWYDSAAARLKVNPAVFIDSVSLLQEKTTRAAYRNEFSIDKDWEQSDTLSIPLSISDSLLVKLWSDTLKSTVSWVKYRDPTNVEPFYSVPADSLFKQLLQESDNFVAEQLILLCSRELIGQLNSRATIELLSDSLLSDMPQAPIWADGSGLSRYNLFTPLTLVELLNRIYQEVEKARIRDLFPTGGKSGTLKDYYSSDPPYIFAKTGTLRNNHALSGFLLTKKGKWLIFSFMHNHFAGSSVPIKEEMERLLWQVHLRY